MVGIAFINGNSLSDKHFVHYAVNPDIYPIPTITGGSLTAMPMPVADQLDETMAALRQKDINILLCLLETEEMLKLGLQCERASCEAAGMTFRHFPIPDFGVPQFDELCTLINDLNDKLAAGQNVLVHCRGGIGRTGLICTCLLAASGMPLPEVIELVSNRRGCTVPETPAQLAMATQFAQVHCR